jgi:hypothetical protein
LLEACKAKLIPTMEKLLRERDEYLLVREHTMHQQYRVPQHN